MNKYESIIIINPNCTDEALKALESKFTGLINENGKVESFENQGKKKLAYEVKKNKEGFYISKNSKKVHICYLTLNQIQIQSKNLKEFTELQMT